MTGEPAALAGQAKGQFLELVGSPTRLGRTGLQLHKRPKGTLVGILAL
jgi:hypothetical protein